MGAKNGRPSGWIPPPPSIFRGKSLKERELEVSEVSDVSEVSEVEEQNL
jgi:hypothetical protein